MIIYYSGNAGVPRIEPETYLKGEGNVMLTYHELMTNSRSQRKRFEGILKQRNKKFKGKLKVPKHEKRA